MKHFGVSAFLAITFLMLFGGFVTPEKGFAFEGDLTQVTQADYVALKEVGNSGGEIEYIAGAVPVEGLGNAVPATLSAIGNAFLSITPMAALSSAITSSIANYGRGTEYFRTAYLDILRDDYAANKNVVNTTKSKLEVMVWDHYISALDQVITTGKTGSNTSTTQENQQAQILKEYAKGKLAIAQSRVLLENGQISNADHTTNTQNAAKTSGAAIAGIVSKLNQTSCGQLTSSPWIGCITVGVTWFVKNILLQIVGFALVASANILDYAMFHGIFEFKTFAPNEIYSIWLVVRQIVSLFVFFAGLFIGFMAVIGKSEDMKKYVAFLVVFGLFVNFSYPIVRVFVDISNVVSLQVYDTTLGPGVLSGSSANGAGGLIVAKMGLQGLVATAATENKGASNSFVDQISSLPGALAAVGFVGYAAYVFFMAAFLIIARTALLVCVIIASPLLLVDTFVPALGSAAQKLRGIFISQLFVAPVFTIMLALTLKFLDVFSLKTGAALSSAVVFFNLIMMLVMLHIMLKVTKLVAGGVGETVTKWAGKAGGLGVGLGAGAAFAGLGFTGRQTLGRVGEKLGEQGGLVGDLGRKMSSGKYDLRNLGATQGVASTLGIYGMGRGVDKSRKEAEDQRNEEALKTAKGLSEEEGNLYLKRKLSGARSGAEYRNFTSNDDDMMKQYINADEKERQKMQDDEKNKRFMQRFSDVDRYDKTISPQEKQQIEAALGAAAKKAFDLKKAKNDDVLEAYIKATDKERARMMADDKNGALKSRMEKVNKYFDGTISDEDRRTITPEDMKAITERAAKDKATQQRNTDRIANYLTADLATRDSIHANATQANDQVLLAQLQVMDNLRGIKPGDITPTDVAALNDQALADKVLANDAIRRDTTAAQTAQAEAAKVVRDAQISSAQALQQQARAAEATNATVASLAGSVGALADRTDDLHQTLRELVNAK